MIKKAMIAAMAVMLSVGAYAQSVIETVATVGMMTVPAVQISLDEDEKVVTEAMRTRLKDAGLKTRNNEGWLAAIEQVFEELSPSPISLFTKVETQGRKNNKLTVVTVCAVPTDLTQNQAVMNAALRSFLESFPQYVTRYKMQQNLVEQEENLKKVEKAAEKATAAVASIDKDIASLEAKIVAKRQEIEKLEAKIEECKADIADLEGKIEKAGGKKNEAERKANAAGADVKAAQSEVERVRMMAQ